MPGFEFDMALPVAGITDGAVRVFDRLGHRWARRDDHADVTFMITFRSDHTAQMRIEPLPAARQTHTLLSPRSLLTVSSDDADRAELDALRHDLILAFLRVAG